MRIRAVLFDYGMVLSGPADQDAYHNLIKLTGLDKDSFDRLYWLWRHEYDAGSFDGIGYWTKIAEDGKQSIDPLVVQRLVAEDVRMWSALNSEMVEWSLRVKEAGLTIGIISNICLELAASVERDFAWLKEFDYLFFSCRLRMAKPDFPIFEHVIQTLAIPANEILFIDDKLENVRSAQAAGMQAIQFSTPECLVEEIKGTEFEAILPQLNDSIVADLD